MEFDLWFERSSILTPIGVYFENVTCCHRLSGYRKHCIRPNLPISNDKRPNRPCPSGGYQERAKVLFKVGSGKPL